MISFALLIRGQFTGIVSILQVACLVLVSVVGALISVVFALWATFRSPKKIDMPAPQNQARPRLEPTGGTESATADTKGTSDRSARFDRAKRRQ